MKNSFLKLSRNLIKDSNSNKRVAFIFKTKTHVILVFNIFGVGKITFENLCSNLSSVASRTTIQSILTEGVNNKFLSKTVYKDDKRKKFYDCENLKIDLEEWYKNNKSIFN